MHFLLQNNAFLPCSQPVTYESPAKKKSEFPQVITHQYLSVSNCYMCHLKDILHLSEMDTLEKEYNELSQRDVENTVAGSIQNLLSDLTYEEKIIQNEDIVNIEKPKVSIVKFLLLITRESRQSNEFKESNI